jgi:hypothetical protein
MINESPTDRRDPRRHKWRLWDEVRRLREEKREIHADRNIRIVGGVVLAVILVVIFAASLAFLIKLLSRVF